MRRIFILIYCLTFTLFVSGERKDSSLIITHLAGNFYVYTTFNSYNGNKVPANGMYVLTSKGAIIFDSPWDTTQFRPLLDSIKIKHDQNAVMCIATHFHDDRTAGLEYYKRMGLKTYTTIQTDNYSKERNKRRAEYLIDKDTSFTIGDESFQTYYPGEGHTRDNIVIWFGKEKILYGGCLIKSASDEDLGYLGDANKYTYANTIKHVKRKCKRPRYIITGHGDWTDLKSLNHTLTLAKKLVPM